MSAYRIPADFWKPILGPKIIAAAKRNNVLLLKELLEEDDWDQYGEEEGSREIDYQGPDGNTALMWAARVGYIESVLLLIDYQADPFLKNNKGRTAFDISVPNLKPILREYADNLLGKDLYSHTRHYHG